jgi:hypothetical protein
MKDECQVLWHVLQRAYLVITRGVCKEGAQLDKGKGVCSIRTLMEREQLMERLCGGKEE